MALTTTQITRDIDNTFSAAAGYSAIELSVLILGIIGMTLFIWAGWGTIGSFLGLIGGKTSAAGFGVSIGLIFSVLILVTFLLAG